MSTSGARLPYELVTMVAKHLVADNAFGICANLNLVSKKIREATLEVLWTTMFWTAQHDPAAHNKEKIEAKWKVFKKSPGAKYIKFMIEPCLFKCNTGYSEDTQISKSLSKGLKASVTLVTCAGQRNLQVHLFGKFGYSEAERECVSRAVNTAKNFPSFQPVTEVAIHIHSKLPTAIVATAPADTVATTDAGIDRRVGDTATPSLSASSVEFGTYLQSLKDLNEGEYTTVTNYALSFIRPYADERIKGSDPGRPAQLVMGGAKISIMVGFGTACMRLWKNDPFHTTFQIYLFLDYDEETGKPSLTPKQQGELLSIFHEAKRHIKTAARTIPLKIMGGFHTSNNRETVYVDASADAKNKKLRSIFSVGYSAMEREEEPLHDVGSAPV